MIKRLFHCSVALMVLSLVAGCGPVAMPAVSMYMITNPKPVSLSNNTKTAKTLLVSNIVAEPGYQSAAMIYSQTPYKLQSFSRNKWGAPPAQMILPLLVNTMRGANYFKAVVSPPFAGSTTYRLDVRLLKLQQEFSLSQSAVRLEVQATLMSNISGRLVASRQFRVVVPAFGRDPYSGVVAANKAVALIDKEVKDFVLTQ
jgi:cholesterol transport system auxiliary component